MIIAPQNDPFVIHSLPNTYPTLHLRFFDVVFLLRIWCFYLIHLFLKTPTESVMYLILDVILQVVKKQKLERKGGFR